MAGVGPSSNFRLPVPGQLCVEKTVEIPVFFHCAGKKYFCLFNVLKIQNEIYSHLECHLRIQSWFIPAEKAEVELPSQVHRKNLNVVENKVFGVLVGIKILFQDYKVVVVVAQLSQGECRAQGMDDPEVEFLERLRNLFGTSNVGVAEQSGFYPLTDCVYYICVI